MDATLVLLSVLQAGGCTIIRRTAVSRYDSIIMVQQYCSYSHVTRAHLSLTRYVSTESWMNVVDWTMGVRIAPDSLSGLMPWCTSMLPAEPTDGRRAETCGRGCGGTRMASSLCGKQDPTCFSNDGGATSASKALARAQNNGRFTRKTCSS